MIKKLSFLVFFFLTALSLFAQDNPLPNFDYSNPRRCVIGEITVSGIKYLDQKALLAISGLTVGDTILIPGSEITKAVKKFWEQSIFSNVKINITKYENLSPVLGKVSIDISLSERPRISKVEVLGVRKGERDDVLEKINLTRGSQVTDYILSNATNKIKSFFYEKGFYKAEVKIVQKDDPNFQNNVDLTITIDKKKKVKIAKIIIEGNQTLSARKIKRAMKDTKEKHFINFKSTKYIEKNFKEDKKNIIAKYNENGYRDARIVSDSVYFVKDNRVVVYIKVEEGKKYYFGNIGWTGNTKYPSEELSAGLKIKKGDVYDQSMLEKRLVTDQDAVGNLYYDEGYLFYRCTPVESSIQGDTINLEMRIVEGPQARINRIIVSGNTKTREYVARREIYTLPGELFSKTDLIRSVRELSQLGHFDPEKLNPTPIPNPSDGTVDIEYALEEKANDQIELSGGWGSGMIIASVGLKLNNFSARNFFHKEAWKPIPSGDGQQLALKAQTNGSYYQSYSLSFTEPWLGGKKPTSLSVSIYRTIQTGGYYGYSSSGSYSYLFDYSKCMRTTGITVGLGKRIRVPDDYFSLTHDLTYQRYDLKNWSSFIMTDGHSNSVSFKTTLARNSSGPSPLYPTTGSNIALSLEVTPPYSLFKKNKDVEDMTEQERYRWIEFHKWKFKGDWFINIFDKFVIASKVEYGILGHYNENYESPFEGFYVGGSGMYGYNYYGRETIALRGYSDGGLTSSNGSSNVYTKYTMELRYPFMQSQTSTIYAHVFTEGGNAWDNISDANPFSIKRSAGFGVRIFLPMIGLMGIDWGYGFDPDYGKTSKHGGEFHFILGQQF